MGLFQNTFRFDAFSFCRFENDEFNIRLYFPSQITYHIIQQSRMNKFYTMYSHCTQHSELFSINFPRLQKQDKFQSHRQLKLSHVENTPTTISNLHTHITKSFIAEKTITKISTFTSTPDPLHPLIFKHIYILKIHTNDRKTNKSEII